MSRKLLGSCSELDTELISVTEVEFEEALNDTIAENDGFVASNNDNVITLAQMNHSLIEKYFSIKFKIRGYT